MLCRQPDSWLEVLLFCTSDTQAHQNGNSNGLNSAPVNGAARDAMLSLQQDTNGGAIPPETLARIDRPELKLSSPFFLKPRSVCADLLLNTGSMPYSSARLVHHALAAPGPSLAINAGFAWCQACTCSLQCGPSSS